jgi:hypothetical protein
VDLVYALAEDPIEDHWSSSFESVVGHPVGVFHRGRPDRSDRKEMGER